MMRRRIRQELHDRQCGCRLAGAGLAHQRHRFAVRDIEGNAIDRQRFARALAKGDRKVFQRKESLRHASTLRISAMPPASGAIFFILTPAPGCARSASNKLLIGSATEGSPSTAKINDIVSRYTTDGGASVIPFVSELSDATDD